MFMRIVMACALVVAAGAWVLSGPDRLDADALDGLVPDAADGERVFIAAGCASCHVSPEGEAAVAAPVMAGGKRFETQFGTFLAPNISSDPEAGIGGWSDLDLANAILRGVSPEGAHYYPAFPYTSYARASTQDVVDLIAHLRTLPADPTPSLEHEIGFPFNIRRTLGFWKLMAGGPEVIVAGNLSPEAERGRHLVEGLGHCGESHTPRNALGMADYGAWLAGAEEPTGDGRIPAITPDALGWTAFDIAQYLSSGFTPSFDTAGGDMVEVIANTARLPEEDRAAIAAYLLAVPGSGS
jgi:mono/diheme cytochrome c family protein